MNAKHALQHRGQSLVEFAAIAPILILLVLGIMEFGRAFYAYATIVNAASEGARYGITHPTDNAGIQQAVIDGSALLNLTVADVTVTRPNGCAVNKPLGVFVNYSFNAVTPLVPNLNLTSASTMTIAYVEPGASCP